MRLFCLLALLIFINSVQAASSVMNSSVGLFPNILIDARPSSSSYCPGDVINITNNVTNIGNNQTVFRLDQKIFDQYSVLYTNETWYNQQILPMQQNFYYMTKLVGDNEIAGMYTVITNLTSPINSTLHETNFRIKQKYGTLVSSPSFIEKTVFPGDFIVEDLYLWLLFPCYGTNVRLNVTGDISNWVYFSANPVYLSPETWNYTRIGVFIDLPWNTIPRDYTGYIIAEIKNEVTMYIPVTIHVQTTAIFDVQTEVISQHKEVCQGSDVTAKVNLLKVFPPEPIDVNMTYIIEYAGNKYSERRETIAVLDTLEKFVTLKLPLNSPEGIYTFYSILDVSTSNWAVNISSSDTFNVVLCQQPPPVAGGTPGGGQSFPLEEKKEIFLNVSRYKITGIVGNLSSFFVTVKNNGMQDVTNIKLQIDGIPLEWITVSPYKVDKIDKGQSADFVVFIKTPLDAKTGVYPFSIKAKNSVESNKENLVFLLSQDEKSLTELLFQESEKYRQNANRTLGMNCIDLSELKVKFQESEKIRELAIDAMLKGEYKKSQEFFLKIISDYESINLKANLLMKERLLGLNMIKIFPFASSITEARDMAEINMKENQYEYFCENVNKIAKYNSYSLAEIIFLSIILILSAWFGYSRYKKMKERRFEEKLKDIKQRLGY
ncbi:MAG: NEW3 domain-containing protein [Candidatus Aenigmarchaeota archaeon]|nr:NEW3 domain-containing protein [Candidatus Aenigmarchaeota archaeon]